MGTETSIPISRDGDIKFTCPCSGDTLHVAFAARRSLETENPFVGNFQSLSSSSCGTSWGLEPLIDSRVAVRTKTCALDQLYEYGMGKQYFLWIFILEFLKRDYIDSLAESEAQREQDLFFKGINNIYPLTFYINSISKRSLKRRSSSSVFSPVKHQLEFKMVK